MPRVIPYPSSPSLVYLSFLPFTVQILIFTIPRSFFGGEHKRHGTSLNEVFRTWDHGIVQLDLSILLIWLWWTCIYLYYFQEHGLCLLSAIRKLRYITNSGINFHAIEYLGMFCSVSGGFAGTLVYTCLLSLPTSEKTPVYQRMDQLTFQHTLLLGRSYQDVKTQTIALPSNSRPGNLTDNCDGSNREIRTPVSFSEFGSLDLDRIPNISASMRGAARAKPRMAIVKLLRVTSADCSR